VIQVESSNMNLVAYLLYRGAGLVSVEHRAPRAVFTYTTPDTRTRLEWKYEYRNPSTTVQPRRLFALRDMLADCLRQAKQAPDHLYWHQPPKGREHSTRHPSLAPSRELPR